MTDKPETKKTAADLTLFGPVPTQPDWPALEHDVLDWWAETDAFGKLVRQNAGAEPWSFQDGPITANNPMAVHHAWGRTYKDTWGRFRAMQGRDLRWQNGYDCQGLWVEVNVERELGFRSKRDIEAHGIAAFVRRCKERVLRMAALQTMQSIRLGMWMSWDDPDTLRSLADNIDRREPITVDTPTGEVTDTVERLIGKLGHEPWYGSYFTFSDENNFMIWHFLKTCHERGWIYQGTDVMPWCTRCGTGLSQHEIVTEGYQETTHLSPTVRFPFVGRPGESLLVWTTTPWTLTSNVAAAVGPELTYLRVRQGDEMFYVAEGAAKTALQGEFEVVDRLRGADMERASCTSRQDAAPRTSFWARSSDCPPSRRSTRTACSWRASTGWSDATRSRSPTRSSATFATRGCCIMPSRTPIATRCAGAVSQSSCSA
jgi:isoleucyl-tRNA synthetase